MNKLLHPRLLGLLLIFLFSTQTNYAQLETIHCWDFNGTSPFTSPLNIDNETTGGGDITHILNINFLKAFEGNTSNACDGSSAGLAFSPERGPSDSTGNNGKYVDFEFSSLGYENIFLSFWTQKTSTGFNNNEVLYSVDGGSTFTSLEFYNPTSISFGGGVEVFDFTTIPTVNDNSSLIIRIEFNGATNSSGNNRIDNVKLSGTLITNNDEDSQVVSPTSQVPDKTITSLDFATQAESIFSFDIQDLGTSDDEPTNVTRMQFLEGINNSTDWLTVINSLVLKNSAGNEVSGIFSVSGSEIIFEPDTSEYS